MLIFDAREIGTKLLSIRKSTGLTQAEVAELAGLSDRTYADIERGSVNMRAETILRICKALHITPNEIFTEKDSPLAVKQDEILERLAMCRPSEKETALRLLSVYLDSLAEKDGKEQPAEQEQKKSSNSLPTRLL